MTSFLIVAGDPSGDLIASKLVTSLKICDPHAHVTGIGGEKLESVCDSFLANIVNQHAIGFAISPKQIHFFRNLLKQVIGPFLKTNLPDVVIPVDFYGFNCHVAKMAKTSRAESVLLCQSPILGESFVPSRPVKTLCGYVLVPVPI